MQRKPPVRIIEAAQVNFKARKADYLHRRNHDLLAASIIQKIIKISVLLIRHVRDSNEAAGS
jgi:hypothetical protein